MLTGLLIAEYNPAAASFNGPFPAGGQRRLEVRGANPLHACAGSDALRDAPDLAE